MQPSATTDIVVRRLHAQRLIGQPFATALDVVRWLGAVQAQDYAGAKWALGMRSRNASDAELDRLFDEGAILRTHVLRPTWHFVAPEHVRWLLELTGPRVLAGLVGRYRQLEMERREVTRAAAALTKALSGGRHLTRAELGEVLQAARIAPDGQRLPHFIMYAELEGLIVSGSRRGKHFTYALLDERAPEGRRLARDQAIAELTRGYFRSHGPAQLKDFVWWSGLATADARAGLAAVGQALEHRVLDGREYWFDPETSSDSGAAGIAHLLPNFDEYTVAYRDRAAMLPPGQVLDPSFISFGSILSNVLTIGGLARGTWRRTADGKDMLVEVKLLDRLSAAELASIQAASQRLGHFLGRPVELRWT